MKVEELRLNNYVYSGVRMVKVKSIHTESVLKDEVSIYIELNENLRHYCVSMYDIKPIELTEEILLNIKGIKNKIVNNKGLELTIYTINNIELLFTFGVLRNIKFMNNKVIIYTAFRDFKLHDLQNLYFVLNGKELEINL